MSDQSMGSAGEQGRDDKDLFAPETAGPSIEASPIPPPPPPPSVTEIGLPEPVPPLDQGPGSPGPIAAEAAEADDAEDADKANEPWATESVRPADEDAQGHSKESGAAAEPSPAADPGQVEDVPWQVPNPTPPWSSPGQAPAPPAAPVPPQPPSAPVPPAPPGGPAPGAPAAPVAPVPPPAVGTQAPPPVPAAPPYGSPGAPAYPGQPAPPVPGYPQAPPPGYPPQPPGIPPYQYPMGPQVVDPHMIGSVMNWLGSGPKRAAKLVFPVLAAVLDDGDVVELLVQGRVRGEPGLAALVGAKLVLVNARHWKPDVITVPVTATLQVQGMNYGHVANLHFVDGDRQEVVEHIGDQPLAYRFAEQVRMRVASVPAPPPSTDSETS